MNHMVRILIRRLILLITLVLCMTSTVVAQSRSGTTAAAFLTIGTGARGQSLGHAYTALATGADALFWNPAGAARTYGDHSSGSVFLSHSRWFADITYNAAATVIPVSGDRVLGLSVAAVNYGTMIVRTVAFPEGTGETFRANDFSLGLSYAQPLTESFYFGGTAKYVRQQIRDMHASTVGFDVGFVLQSGYLGGLVLAASIQNFGGKMQMTGINSVVFVDIDETTSGNNPDIPARIEMDAWDLPLSFKFGMAMPVVQVGMVELTALADIQQSNDNSLNSDVGAQLRVYNRTFNFDLRGGYKDLFLDNVDSHATFGAGLDVRAFGLRIGFDYAYTPFDLLGQTQVVDFRMYF
ncbi:MAG: PorV/PorQ family protein [Rhodothermaceae bacterium]|nr:PorV/PorQ family protein [Rhodothermaceae bacterium]MYD18511.1 PorV/PorQ family protein [Rhodothermaceae bacterium]MYD56008.1 PorV/PorQ family protein [Rhodothermaceae bacterium]MYI43276.1 PorV/PorQ family protein [Rhodothermaceae bacterium]MYJ54876.1 PorV/PorQ family protein [Rhodothermaceae bacterium]